MQVDELRRQLVSTAMSYKNEKMRNQAFEQKLNLAIKQLSRREEVIQAVADLQEANEKSVDKMKALEHEKDKEE
jgi:hypothetical protein